MYKLFSSKHNLSAIMQPRLQSKRLYELRQWYFSTSNLQTKCLPSSQRTIVWWLWNVPNKPCSWCFLSDDLQCRLHCFWNYPVQFWCSLFINLQAQLVRFIKPRSIWTVCFDGNMHQQPCSWWTVSTNMPLRQRS